MRPWLRPVVTFLTVCFAGVAVSTQARAQGDDAPPRTLDDLHSRIQGVLEETGAPGMIGALVTRNNVLWVGGIGLADQETGRPADKTTLFRVGSISKSFTSLAVLILHERGLLSLDAKVNNLVPEAGVVNAWADVEPVRVEHVLQHPAGFDDLHMRDYVHGDPTLTVLEGIQFNTTSRTVRWRPGTRMSYSNIGPPIAALALEKVTGARFEDFVEREIFAPLGMRDATFLFDERVAKGYDRHGQRETPYRHGIFPPSGALNASAPDMARFVRLLLNRGALDGYRVVAPDLIDRMEIPSTTWAARVGVTAGAGLGNFSEDRDGFRLHGHDGQTPGFLSSYGYLPGRGLGYFYSVNASNGRAFGRIGELLLGYVTRDSEPDPQQPVVALSGDALHAFEGYYEPDSPRNEVQRSVERLLGIVSVEADGEGLTVSPLFGNALRLLPVAGDQFRREEEARASVVFVRDGADQYAQEVWITRKRISAWSAWIRWILSALSVLLMLSAPVFALIWLPRLMLGRLSGTSHLRARWVPLAAVACLVACVILSRAGAPLLGRLTIWSVAFTALTWLFALCTLLGVWQVWTARHAPMHRGVWWHAALVSAANLVVLSYLGYGGLIGLRLWAA